MTFLHWIGDSLRSLLEQVPLSVARWILIGIFLLLIFWVIQLPATATTPGTRQSKWYEDLKVWAWITLMSQIMIYAVF